MEARMETKTGHVFAYSSNTRTDRKRYVSATLLSVETRLSLDQRDYKRYKLGQGEWKGCFSLLQYEDVQVKCLETVSDIPLDKDKAGTKLTEHKLRWLQKLGGPKQLTNQFDIIPQQVAEAKGAAFNEETQSALLLCRGESDKPHSKRRLHKCIRKLKGPKSTLDQKILDDDTAMKPEIVECTYCGRKVKNEQCLRIHQTRNMKCLAIQGKPSPNIGKRGYCTICGARASFAENGKRAVHCKKHAEKNEIDVCNKRCEQPGCDTNPTYGLPGQRARHCLAHIETGEVDIINKNKRCGVENCPSQPVYGQPGRRPRHCAFHAEMDEVDVINKRCTEPGCPTQPRFAPPGERPTHCHAHRKSGEEDVANPQCHSPGCYTRPNSGLPGQRPMHCAEHRLPGEVLLFHPKLCISTGCQSYAYFNFSGQLPRHCRTHAESGEIDVYNKCCSTEGCQTRAVAAGKCTVHHPDYIRTMVGASKVSCDFIDALSTELGLKVVMHKHYDKLSKSVSGKEFAIPGTRYHADGYFSMPQSEKKLPVPITAKGIIIEFHGHLWHGYPNGDKKDEYNYFGARFGDLYESTMERMHKIKRLGYSVIYIWERDFAEWKKHRVGQPLLHLCTVL